jgi:hypothetical protein
LDLQEKPGAQSELALQPTVHTAFTQAWGVQSVFGPAAHLPFALQVEVPTIIGVLPADLQAVGAQMVPAG